ncbi:hypothetical protein Avbf_12859, partial [Armadillidium vulgare]
GFGNAKNTPNLRETHIRVHFLSHQRENKERSSSPRSLSKPQRSDPNQILIPNLRNPNTSRHYNFNQNYNPQPLLPNPDYNYSKYSRSYPQNSQNFGYYNNSNNGNQVHYIQESISENKSSKNIQSEYYNTENRNDSDFVTRFITHSSLELRFWSDILTYKRILGVSAEKPELDWIDIPAE